MKSIVFNLATALLLVFASGGQLRASEAQIMDEKVPDEVVASAVKAVSDLGKAVVQGKYQMALDRMNPVWKERNAKRLGGMKELERRLQVVAKQMVKQGITMVSCKPQGKPQAFGVTPVVKQVRDGGKMVERLVYSQWLVLVPTVTHFRILKPNDDGGAAEWIEIESLGYQVAVTDRGKDDWTFIDGAGLTVNELRTIYGTLPQNLVLPKVGKRQAQEK